MKQSVKKRSEGYVSRFLSYKCAGDVLNALDGFNRAEKEITESMAIISQIKPLVLKKKMKYTLVDLCAGNCLTSVLAVHLLPVKQAIAIDIREKKPSKFKEVKRFEYWTADIKMNPVVARLKKEIDGPIIVIGVHACRGLATRVIEIHQQLEKSALFLMPCCKGEINNIEINRIIPHHINNKLSKYDRWSWYLADKAKGDFIVDGKILSPCNAIVRAGIK